MVERIRDAQVAEEIAAQAGVESTPDLHLSDALTPVIFGPQRPPLASSGYFPGTMGASVAAVTDDFSNLGLFVSGANSNSVVRVNSITIFNPAAADQAYGIRRLDDVSGFTLVRQVPGYISAGNPMTGGVFRAIRADLITNSGALMASVNVEGLQQFTFPGPWILNDGAVIVVPSTVNTAMFAYFNYEHWTAIRRQPVGG